MSPAAEQAVVAVLFALFIGLGFAAFWRRARALAPGDRPWLIGLAMLVVVGTLIRLVLVAPAFVHVNFHGPVLMESILEFPNPEVHRSEYGQGSFFVLGLFAAIFGRNAETVFRFNAIASALTAVPIALVAARWSDRRQAGLYAAAVWSTSPLVCRIALSEDAHVLAVFFGVVALAALLRSSKTRSHVDLAFGLTAALLAVLTRQTMLPWTPFVAAVIAARERKAKRADAFRRTLAIGLALVIVVTFARAVATAGKDTNVPLLVAWKLMITRPALLAAMLGSHPLVALRELGPMVPALLAAGMIAIRKRTIGTAVLVSFAVMFVLTLPFDFPEPGVAWSFRLPLYALVAMLCGPGAAAVVSQLGARKGEGSGTIAIATGIIAMVTAMGTASFENRRQDPEWIEYRFLRAELERAPKDAVVVSTAMDEPAPSYALPRAMAHRLGLRDVVAPAAAPAGATLIFLDGIGCHARSLVELASPPGARLEGEEAARVLGAALDASSGSGSSIIVRRATARESCDAARSLLASAGAVHERSGPTVDLRDEPPMAYFDVPRVELQLLVVDGTNSSHP